MILTIDTSEQSKALPWFEAKGTDRIIQNIKNIVSTYKYEVAYMRGFGMSPDAIDKDVETMKSIITEDLLDNIKEYEPRATLISVNVKEISADGGVIAVVQIEI